MNLITLLNGILIFLVILIVFLAGAYFLIIYKNKIKNNKKEEDSKDEKSVTNDGAIIDTIYNFLDFDEVMDNMIVRKNKSQYVMVIKCQGVNYDLLSEDEKISTEEGFVQFLNTLKFPIQFYIQTTSLNLQDILEQYKEKIERIKEQIEKIELKIGQAKEKQDIENLEKLEFEKRKKQNVLSYAVDLAENVGRLSLNKNILQQKNYIVISYFVEEAKAMTSREYTEQEVSNICFSELYTRAQSIIRSLASAGVMGRVLDSEEIVTLLYTAYNRDEAEIIQFNKALELEYDSLYSTGEDVIEKRKEQIEKEAEELIKVSVGNVVEEIKEKNNLEKKEQVKKRALEILQSYRNQINGEVYEKTKGKISESVDKKNNKPKREAV